jgi:hypothetical protein
MADRSYRVFFAKDRAGVSALAVDGWTVLESTIREFKTLDTDDDLSFGEIGRVKVTSSGFVALAYK